MIKGYVVRGKWRDGHIVHAFWWPAIERVHWTVDRNVVPDDATLLFATLGEAVAAMFKSSHLADVRIFAVAEDGAETPLPTYEEALAAVDKAAKRDAAWARLVEKTAERCQAIAGDYYHDAMRAEYEAAREALADLGVDAALLSD